MGWFNPYGLAVIILIMIPNVVFAVKKQRRIRKRMEQQNG